MKRELVVFVTAAILSVLLAAFFVFAAEPQPAPTYEQLIEARGRLIERKESRIVAANTEVNTIDAQLKQVQEEIDKLKGTGQPAKTK